MGIRSDGSLISYGGGGSLAVHGDGPLLPTPNEFPLLGVITGGTNPYSWRRIYFTRDGNYELFPRGTAGCITSSGPWARSEFYPDDPTVFPLWEMTGNRNVLPGTIVQLFTRYNNFNIPARAQEYWFRCQDGPIVGRLSPATLTGTLGTGMDHTTTSISVSGGTAFPGRNGFKIVIDAETMEVVSGAGTSTWTVLRNVEPGPSGTSSFRANHASGVPVLLTGQFSWKEVRPTAVTIGGWEDRHPLGITDNPPLRTGTQLQEPATERNHYCGIPPNNVALLWRKSSDGVGFGTLNADITPTSSTVSVSVTVAFPVNGNLAGFCIRIENEYMRVTGTGGSFSVSQRGAFGTLATLHEAGSPVVEAVCEWCFTLGYCLPSVSGFRGARGISGISGLQGQQGPPGIDAADGMRGLRGPPNNDLLLNLPDVTDGITDVTDVTLLVFSPEQFVVGGFGNTATVGLAFGGPNPVLGTLSTLPDPPGPYPGEECIDSDHVHELAFNFSNSDTSPAFQHVFQLNFRYPAFAVSDVGAASPYGEKYHVELNWGSPPEDIGGVGFIGSSTQPIQSDHIHQMALGMTPGGATAGQALLSSATSQLTQVIAVADGVYNNPNAITVTNGIVTFIS